jgi:hypothetical protein
VKRKATQPAAPKLLFDLSTPPDAVDRTATVHRPPMESTIHVTRNASVGHSNRAAIHSRFR